ncbi:unnamed protein product [Spirodela intermedia]|uniref:Uncharacterized protein n=1 Tax=Spirodela intermedia TaxID=51605 RepID=A0A7I8K3L2_SPIIN|nr:unnamed protein product [Spirodela intermedia]
MIKTCRRQEQKKRRPREIRTTSPVVIMADLIAAGDQSGWKLLIYAATAAAWGVDIDVPERMLKRERRGSLFPVIGTYMGCADSMSTPGATISGCPHTPAPS